MKAIQILGTPTSPTLATTTTCSLPSPSPSQLLIRVHSSAITHDELTWPEPYRTPSRIPGHDISGTIHSLPPSYSGPFSAGDPVYGMLSTSRGQGQAEYVIALDEDLALKPKSLSHAQAAALPIPVVTAMEALEKHAGPQEGERVLVTGASGAVGMITVQLAKKIWKAEVVALASREKEALVRGLGADEVVDYRKEGWEERMGMVDIVIDTVGSEILAKSWRAVKNGGRIVTVADPPPVWAGGKAVPRELEDKDSVKYVYFVLDTGAEALEKVAGMIDRGEVVPLPVIEFPFEKALEAWKVAGERGRKGKVVINFDADT